MAQIHVLDSETIDKIAAGEVVERPASVVKELVENAIDAGATAITVEAKEGGIEFIRVTDNGCGMEREQLRTAFLRHATSKIQTAADLTEIRSLGFRGEALSSISAVAKVEVITKTADSLTGSRIVLEGAKEISFDEIGAPEGTTFIMRNLFFHTPVRRKFLKQPATEGGYIADLMEHLALSRPDISFKLVMGNQMKFHTSGNGDLREVIYRIYGRETSNELVPIQTERNGIRIEGYLGKPIQVRSNRNFEIYFINGRFVRSNVVSRAIEEGYKEYLMQHKFPFCVLHLTMDTERVDVNVHPTKMDVRFSDAPGVATMICEAVRTALQAKEMIPDVLLSTEKEIKAQVREARAEAEKQRTPEPFEYRRGDSYRVMEEMKYDAERPKMQEMIQNPLWIRGNTPGNPLAKAGKMTENPAKTVELSKNHEVDILPKITVPGENGGGEVITDTEAFFMETTELRENTAENSVSDAEGREETHGWNVDDASMAGMSEQAVDAEKPNRDVIAEMPGQLCESSAAQQLNLFEEKILIEDNRPKFRIIGQVFETYWLIEFDNRLMMVDQHAAHEKVNYERLMKQYREKSVTAQRLMPPVIVSLSGQEEVTLKENRECFEALGFELEAFGGNEYALRSVPTDLYGCGEREMFLEVLDQLTEKGNFGDIRVVEEKIASMSCKAAVKGNQLLSFAEAEALIDELLTLENPYNCPHGRPTIVAMTKAEMDKKFKRIV